MTPNPFVRSIRSFVRSISLRPQPEGRVKKRSRAKTPPSAVTQFVLSAWIIWAMSLWNGIIMYLPVKTAASGSGVRNRRDSREALDRRWTTARNVSFAARRNRKEYDTIFAARLAFKYGWGDYFIGLAVHARHTCESSWAGTSGRILFILKPSTSSRHVWEAVRFRAPLFEMKKKSPA